MTQDPQEDTFFTITDASKSIFKEKGSKFLGFAFPAKSEDDITDILKGLQKEYHDARHHCYGYILGTKGEKYRANDAGEPNHSAGDPILGQIRSRGLTNTLVVVVRYFGGTKLGVGGLISAYKTAAAEALDTNVIREETVKEVISLKYAYEDTNDVMRILNEFAPEIVEQKFTTQCYMKVAVRKSHFIKLKEKIHNYLQC